MKTFVKFEILCAVLKIAGRFRFSRLYFYIINDLPRSLKSAGKCKEY